jgi:hypothetical protein
MSRGKDHPFNGSIYMARVGVELAGQWRVGEGASLLSESTMVDLIWIPRSIQAWLIAYQYVRHVAEIPVLCFGYTMAHIFSRHGPVVPSCSKFKIRWQNYTYRGRQDRGEGVK